jgi:hypothetical protein
MNDRGLAESDWKRFAKSGSYKDAAVVKALAALEKASTPAHKLASLDEVEKQLEILRKANKADKSLADQLDEMGNAAAKERKLQESEARNAAASAASGGDDSTDSPALMTTAMVPLMRLVKQGEPMKAVVAIAGKEVAVMIGRRPATPAQRKLLTDDLAVTGGLKFAAGDCLWEENAMTFVLQTQAAGLAKKIGAALLKQIGQRVKVRVRGEGLDDIDEDGDVEGVDAVEAVVADKAGPAAPAAADPVAAAGADGDASRLADVRAQLLALGSRLQQAIVASPANKAALVQAVQQLNGHLQRKDTAEAGAGLTRLIELLSASTAADSAPAPAAATAGPSFVQMQKARLDWQATRALLRQRLRALEMSLVAHFEDHPEAALAREGADRMAEVLTALDDGLSDTLDEALNAADADLRLARLDTARQQLESYAEYARSSPLVADLDDNPFVPVDIRTTILRSTQALGAALA